MRNPSDEAYPYFAEEHEMLRRQIRRFVEERVKPNADRWEEEGYVPREILQEMGTLGFLGIRYPAAYGGSEFDTLATVVLAEELGRSTYGGFAITVLVHTDMASPYLVHVGSNEQLSRYMPDIISGRRIAAVAMTEAYAGSDLAAMRTTAHRSRHGWRLNGSKMFITNGARGDIFIVAAKTGQAGRNRDVSLFIVEKGAPGFAVSRTLEKHGWLSSDTAELIFEECLVPHENLLGEVGRGFYALMKKSRTSASCCQRRRWARRVAPSRSRLIG